jgi:hypothetical protein
MTAIRIGHAGTGSLKERTSDRGFQEDILLPYLIAQPFHLGTNQIGGQLDLFHAVMPGIFQACPVSGIIKLFPKVFLREIHITVITRWRDTLLGQMDIIGHKPQKGNLTTKITTHNAKDPH